MKNVLAPESDAVFQGVDSNSGSPDVMSFDLSHLDRISKSQLRSIHLIHEEFVRNLAASLSAHLRSAVTLNLVSLEQIPHAQFLEGLSFPTCMAYIGMTPFEGTAVLEMNMGLMFTLMELLMGSKASGAVTVQRKITEIEKSIMQTLFRVILRDLSIAWSSIAKIDFAVQSLASEADPNRLSSASEAGIVIAVDVRIAAVSGLLNLAIPSRFIKRLRHKFDQPQPSRLVPVNSPDQPKIARLIQDVNLTFEAILDGGTVSARTLVDLEPGHVLLLDHPIDQPVKGTLNGRDKWVGTIGANQQSMFFRMLERIKVQP